MKSAKKAILTMAVVALCLSWIFPIRCAAAGKAQTPGQPTTPQVEKQVGANVKAVIKDGVITLSGTGATYDYTDAQFAAGQTPLYDYCRYGSKRGTIKKIVVGKDITRVGNLLFYGIDAKTVTFENAKNRDLTKLTSIGDNCFHYNTTLESIVIPGNVVTIGEGAFGDCTALTKIDLCGEQLWIPSLTSVGKFAFFRNKVSSVVIPNGVKSVPDSAFAHSGQGDDDDHNESYQNSQPTIKWQIVINLDPNGGTCSQPVMVRVTGNKYKSLPAPKRSGYTFSGWYCGKNKITADSKVKYEHKTLTAKWTKGIKTPKISKLSAVTKGFKITVSNLDSSATKYIIQYSTDSGFNNCSSVTKSKSTKTSTIKSLKAGKKYYVRVRAMKKTSSGTKYSAWSEVKKVTTKY